MSSLFRTVVLYWLLLLCLGLEHNLKMWFTEVSSALGDLDILFSLQ